MSRFAYLGRTTEENFGKIRVGTTRQAVNDLLGRITGQVSLICPPGGKRPSLQGRAPRRELAAAGSRPGRAIPWRRSSYSIDIFF